MSNKIDINGLEYINVDFNKCPKTKEMIEKITEILNYCNSEEMKELKKRNKMEYEDKVLEKYKNFADNKFKLVMSLIYSDNTPFSVLKVYFKIMGLIEMKTISQEYGDELIAEYMNEKYIYSQYGGKENFEKFVKENVPTNRKEKRKFEQSYEKYLKEKERKEDKEKNKK
jgi:hypothetical protein